MTFDQMRAAFPHLVFNVYGMDPRGIVTLEALLPDGTAVQEKAWTLQGAIDVMFPSEDAPAPPEAPPAPALTLLD